MEARSSLCGSAATDLGTRRRALATPAPASRGQARAGEDKSRWVDEIEDALLRARSTSRCTPPRTSPASWPTDWRCSARPRRAGAEDVALLAPAAAGGSWRARRARRHEQHPPPGAAARRARGPRGGRDRAATSTRACASSPSAEARRDRARPRRACSGSAARTEIGAVLDPARFVPAPGQGMLALEARAEDDARRKAVTAIIDADASACLLAERALAQRAERQLPHPARRVRQSRGLRLPAAARLGRAARRLGLGGDELRRWLLRPGARARWRSG